MEIKKPMLASKIKDMEKLSYPILCTTKLDGIRCLVINGEAVSRNFKPIPNIHIRGLISGLPSGLDGEIMIIKGNFQAVSSSVMSEDGEPDFIYSVFDYMSGDPSESYDERMNKLRKLKLPSFVKKILPTQINNEEELLSFEEKCLKNGDEGVMTRKPNGKYKFGRSTENEGLLLKLKRFSEAEAIIVECVEKKSNQNEAKKNVFGRTERSSEKNGMIPVNTLGSFKVKDVKTGVEFSIGSGFNDAFREEVWNNKSKYVGKIITYIYQPFGVKNLPRFPVFKNIREDLK